jgi:membrane protease YdiL (CAAX protease family)
VKKCPWCGTEYPDATERCAIDDQPLDIGEAVSCSTGPTDVAPSILPTTDPPEFAKTAALFFWQPTDRQLLVFELVLLCVVAFGGSIVYAAQHIPGLTSSSPVAGSRSWLYSTLHEISALGLLWYILLRRSRSISDLGFSWNNKDLVRSALVWAGGTGAFLAVYTVIYAAGMTSATNSTASARVGRMLFGPEVSAMAIIFAFINPFFEELIVRAYLMTEVQRLTNSVSKAVLLSALVQMSYHFYQGAPMAFAEGAAFLVFSIYYARTNRITPVILAHLYMDVFATLAFMLRHR